jgi:hypothetical protein
MNFPERFLLVYLHAVSEASSDLPTGQRNAWLLVSSGQWTIKPLVYPAFQQTEGPMKQQCYPALLGFSGGVT